MSVNVGEAKGYLDLDITGFLAGLKTAQSEANTATKSMATTVGTNLTSAGRSITSAGKSLTKNFTAPIVAAGTACVTLSANFESAMSKVSALSGATGGDMDKLKKKALEMGSKTKYSASEAAEGFQYMALAGWDTESMLEGIEPILKLAGAAEIDLGTASDIVTDALTAMGLEAKDTAKFTDVLATTMANSNTDVTQMGEAFKYAAPLAGTLGYSIDDLGLALGTMANAGIKGSQAGTSLRRLLMNMADPTDKTAAAMDALGISMFNEDGSARSLKDVLGQLRTSMAGCTEEQKAQYASALAGATGMSGLLAIVDASDESWDALASSIDNADGSTNQMYDTMQNNLSGQLIILKSTLESLAISLGDLMLPLIKSLVEKIQGWVEWLNNLDDSQKETIIKIAAVVAAIGPLLLIIGKAITTIGGLFNAFNTIKTVAASLKTAMTALGTAIGGISAPVVAVVAVIAVLVAAFVTLWQTNEDFRNKITAIWDGIKAKFEEFGQAIVERLNALGFDFSSFTEVLKAAWEGFCNLLAPLFEGVFQRISNILSAVLDVIIGILDIFIGLFTGNWEQMWNGVKEVFGAIWNFLVATFQNYLNVFKGVADVVLGWFGTSWDECWTAIKDFFVNIWNNIVSFFTGILNGIKTFFETIWNGISTFFTTIWTAISTTVTTVATAIWTTIQTIFTTISSFFMNIWNSIVSFLTSAWETIKNIVQVGLMFIQEIISAAFQLITLPFRFIWENCKDTLISLWETMKSAVSTALNAIQAVITTVWTAVSTFFSTIWNAISTFLLNIWNTIKTNITTAINAIKTVLTTVFTAIQTTITTIWNAISTFFTTIWNTIKTNVTNAINAIKTTITTVVNAIKTTIQTVFNAISSFFTTIWNTIKTTITNAVNSVKTTVTNVFNSIKSTATSVWNGIKSAIETPINAAKNTISSVVNSIKSTISSGFNAAKSTVTSVFNSIKSSIQSVMNSASSIVSGAINKIKGFFNFSWSLPKLKMPHPSISGSFSLNPPSVPHFSIDWYKKAMDNAMILNGATIFGAKGGNLLGGGEAGSEVVSGTDTLMRMIEDAVNNVISGFIEKLESYVQQIMTMFGTSSMNLLNYMAKLVDASHEFVRAVDDIGYIAQSGFTKTKQETRTNDNGSNQKDSGDTFIFNSPKPIDEIEAAKQMKRTKRDMAEGFA